MVSVLTNSLGYVYAYAEWRLLNEYGFPFEPLDHIFIKHLWIHEDYRETKTINNLIAEIDKDPVGKDADVVYWRNLKHNKLSRTFKRVKARTKGVDICG